MPIQEDRLKKRLEIRASQVADKDVLMVKLREKIKGGFLPSTPEQFADILKMVSEYGRHLGYVEECREILEKLSEEGPAMEKYGVECKGDHNPSKGYMEKKAGGDVVCRHCGARFGEVHLHEKQAIREDVRQAKADAKGSIEKMLNM